MTVCRAAVNGYRKGVALGGMLREAKHSRYEVPAQSYPLPLAEGVKLACFKGWSSASEKGRFPAPSPVYAFSSAAFRAMPLHLPYVARVSRHAVAAAVPPDAPGRP